MSAYLPVYGHPVAARPQASRRVSIKAKKSRGDAALSHPPVPG